MTTSARLDVVTLLAQDRIWIARTDQGGLVEQRLDDMDPGHRASVLAWLREYAGMLHRGTLDDLVRAWKVAQGDRRALEDEMSWLAAQQPARWLEDQPLVLALARVVPRRPPLERRRRVRRIGAGHDPIRRRQP